MVEKGFVAGQEQVHFVSRPQGVNQSAVILCRDIPRIEDVLRQNHERTIQDYPPFSGERVDEEYSREVPHFSGELVHEQYAEEVGEF